MDPALIALPVYERTLRRVLHGQVIGGTVEGAVHDTRDAGVLSDSGIKQTEDRDLHLQRIEMPGIKAEFHGLMAAQLFMGGQPDLTYAAFAKLFLQDPVA